MTESQSYDTKKAILNYNELMLEFLEWLVTINNYDKPSTWITGSLQINDLVAYLLTKITDLFAWLAT